MDRDGTGAGYDLALLRAISEAVHVPVVASGGAGELEHFAAALDRGGADAVLAAQHAALRPAHDPPGEGVPRRPRQLPVRL